MREFDQKQKIDDPTQLSGGRVLDPQGEFKFDDEPEKIVFIDLVRTF